METADICRLCGVKEEINIDIFEQGSEYPHLIHSLLPLRVKEDDNLPQKLCYRCAFKLKEFYSFRERCLLTEALLKSSQVKEEFCHLNGSDVKCMEEQLEDVKKGQFEVRQHVTSSNEAEIVIIDSDSPSPASDVDSTLKSPLVARPGSNCKNSTPEEEEETKGQTCKRKETEECQVFLNIPDENATVNGISTANESCHLNVNKSGSEGSPVAEKRVKRAENSTPCADSVTGTGRGANLNETAASEGSKIELSTSCVAKGIANETESVRQAGEKNCLTSCKSYYSKQNINVPDSLIVTKIPGFSNVYTCSHCERTFTVMDSAINHNCDKMPVQFRYECELCNKTFSRQAILSAHRKCHFSFPSDDESL